MDSDDEDAQFLTLEPVSETPTIDFVQNVPKAAPLSIEKDIESARAQKKAQAYAEKLKQRGLVYIGRIPPKMSPKFIRSMLRQFGELDRIYLEPENEDKFNARKQRTKNNAGGLRYVGGWVEFLDKRHAKKCALVLNNTPMSSTTGSRQFKDDLWCIKYFTKVKWEDITAAQSHAVNVHRVKKAQVLEAGAKEASRILEFHERRQERQFVEKKMEAKKRKRADAAAAAEAAAQEESQQLAKKAKPSTFRRLD